MKTAETTTTCPKCGLACQGPRVRPHNCAKRQAHPEHYLPTPLPRPAAPSGPDSTGRKGGPAERQAPAPGTLSTIPAKGARVLTLDALDVMPPTPQAGRSLKEMSLSELEAADRALRAMPERLEKLSGITAVLNGLVLAEIKAKLAHKQFTPWLTANYGKSASTARRYMQLGAAFSQNAHGARFDEQQLTLALLDATAEQTLDLAHPVVQAVEKWADGRSYKTLIAEETGDGRADNPGGVRPSLEYLRPWLAQEFPDHPEYAEALFGDLPAEVQKRFLTESPRYVERLTKEQKEEIAREASAREWLEIDAPKLTEWADQELWHYAADAQLKEIESAAEDLLSAIRKTIRQRAEKRPALKGAAR